MATTKTSLAYQQLSKTLGAKPPKALDDLPAKDLQDLVDKVEAAYADHKESVAQAEDSIINSAPRPLRGTVRKILGA
jgi:hypothetical protein